MKALLAVPAMLIAMNSAAECPADYPTSAPDISLSASATRSDLESAQIATQAYIDSVDKFLTCRAAHLHDLAHNYYVYEAETAAENYNAALRAFQQREALAGN